MRAISSIILFLSKYWQIGVIAGVLLGIWATFHNLKKENAILEKDKAHLVSVVSIYKSNEDVYKNNQQTLKSEIKKQNDYVLQLKKDADDRYNSFKGDIEKAHEATLSAQKKASNILAAKPKSKDLCEAANILINEALVK